MEEECDWLELLTNEEQLRLFDRTAAMDDHNALDDFLFSEDIAPETLKVSANICLKHRLYEVLRLLVLVPAMPDEILHLVKDDPELLTPLGHRRAPLELVKYWAFKYQYDEAGITFGFSLLDQEEVDWECFRELLERFREKEWVTRSLFYFSEGKDRIPPELFEKFAPPPPKKRKPKA